MPGFDRKRSKVNQVFNLCLILYLSSLLVATTLATVFAFCFPRGSIFVSELIPLRYYSFFPTGFVISLIHARLMYAICFNISILTSSLVIYFFYTSVVLLEELTFGKTRYKTISNFRKLHNIVIVYRSLSILNIIITNIIGKVLVFMHTAMMLIPIYASFTLITTWRDIGFVARSVLLVIGVVTFVFWTAVLQLGKFLHVKGMKLMVSWKRPIGMNRKESQEMNKFRRSCQLLVVKCDGILVVRRMTQFVFVKGVLKGTFRSLLTLGTK